MPGGKHALRVTAEAHQHYAVSAAAEPESTVSKAAEHAGCDSDSKSDSSTDSDTDSWADDAAQPAVQLVLPVRHLHLGVDWGHLGQSLTLTAEGMRAIAETAAAFSIELPEP